MNLHTSAFCRGLAGYYQNLRPADLDLHELRALWARADVFAKLPDLSTDSPTIEADRASAFSLPGDTFILPHREGLHLRIAGEILPDFPVPEYIAAIEKASGPITIRLNSGGGDLLAAFAIHDALLAAGPGRVEALVCGFCGSAATLILAAADRRRVVTGSKLWIHGPSFLAWGNSDALRESADQLDRLLPRMANAYRRICDPAIVDDWLNGEDYFFTAQEARAVGLATEVLQPMEPPAGS